MIHYGKQASTGILLSLKTEVKMWYAFAENEPSVFKIAGEP